MKKEINMSISELEILKKLLLKLDSGPLSGPLLEVVLEVLEDYDKSKAFKG